MSGNLKTIQDRAILTKSYMVYQMTPFSLILNHL